MRIDPLKAMYRIGYENILDYLNANDLIFEDITMQDFKDLEKYLLIENSPYKEGAVIENYARPQVVQET